MKAKRTSAKETPAPLEIKEAAVPYVVAADPAAMVRTQIYLTKPEYDFLQKEGLHREVPMAAIIRSYIDERMHVPEDAWTKNPMLQPLASDPSWKGHEDGAINHDHYINGSPKKWIKRKGKWVESPPLPDDYNENAKSRAAYDTSLRQLDESK